MSKNDIAGLSPLVQGRFSPRFLRPLFSNNAVLVGAKFDELYLHHAVVTGSAQSAQASPVVAQADSEEVRIKANFLFLVMAAAQQGVQHVVIDFAPEAQPGIDEAMSRYRETMRNTNQSHALNSLLAAAHTTLMDIVLGAAALLGLRVHALNTGHTVIARLFREAQGSLTIPTSASEEEKIKIYMRNSFEEDKSVLNKVLRRQANPAEIQMFLSLAISRIKSGDAYDKLLFDEKDTAEAIKAAIGDKRFIGFFQRGRLWNDHNNGLGACLKAGDERYRVVTLTIGAPEDGPSAGKPDYYLRDARDGSATGSPFRPEVVPYAEPSLPAGFQGPRPATVTIH